uniref:Uncharacterized protein n=1 Tax=Sphenodon punctatus TaxID=8508 RepID=A0A8D0G1R6_SPHPU
SPQEVPFDKVFTVPQYNLVISTDARGTIKVWHGDTGEELAAFSTSSSSCTLITYIVNNKPFLTAGTAGGALYTFEATSLNQASHIIAFQNSGIDLLLCSPDKQWIVAGSTNSASVSSKVFYAECLIDSTDEPPISNSLPISKCTAACWLPNQAARIAIMHEEHAAFQMNITVFDIALKKTKYKLEILAQQVASFAVPGGSWREQTIMQGYGTETILLGHGSELKLCSVFGTQHETFQDHKNTITSIWVV